MFSFIVACFEVFQVPAAIARACLNGGKGNEKENLPPPLENPRAMIGMDISPMPVCVMAKRLRDVCALP
jgi:hypothetical protein